MKKTLMTVGMALFAAVGMMAQSYPAGRYRAPQVIQASDHHDRRQYRDSDDRYDNRYRDNRTYSNGYRNNGSYNNGYYNNSYYNNGYYNNGYGYNNGRYERDRSTGASVAIVGGSAAAGAALGGLMGGGKGAILGAIIGGGGGLIYDRATADKDHDGDHNRYRGRR